MAGYFIPGFDLLRRISRLAASWIWDDQTDPPGNRKGKHNDSLLDLTGQIVGKGAYPDGLGTFCDVWKCVKHEDDSGGLNVAVKAIRIQSDDQLIPQKSEKLCDLVRVWVRLDHSNVRPILGVVWGFGPLPSLVSPWVEGGSLTSYLKTNPDLSMDHRLYLLEQITDGLLYLHSQGIVHGDLNGGNVLMDARGKPYIVDYGLLPLLLEFRTAPYLSTPVGRAVRWAAPDLFQIPEDGDGSTINFTYASDVYSFGSLMLQILSGQIPYDYVKRDEQVLYAIAKGLRPNRPSSENITDTYWDFIQGCWSSDPKDRPSAKELLSFIRRERNQ